MSVIGVDFGNSTCIAARVGRGGVDVVLNGNSNRKTPTMVSYLNKQRLLGEHATAVATSNNRNTVTNLKRLVGLPFNSPQVQKEARRLPVELVEMKGGRTGVKVNYCGEERAFGVEMVVGAMLEDIRRMVEGDGKAPPVSDVVISVPGFFTDSQRRAMLDACHVSGLKCLRLMNDLTAAAIEYGIYKSARRQFSDTEPQYVMFIDMGHSAYQVSVVAFLQGKLHVLSYAFDRDLGGRDFDDILADHMAQQFKEKTGQSADTPKARMKLLSTVEKARKTLSPVGVKEVRVDVECLNGDYDLHTKITEDEFAEWTECLTARTTAPIDRALKDAGVTMDKLSSVEILGGAIRMRVVKQRIAAHLNLANQTPPNFGLSTTLNMDECIARGCALQSAILSPLFRVKEFNVVDRVMIPIRLTWEESGAMEVEGEGEGADNTVVIFQAGDDTPKIRRVTFRRTEPFTVTATYDDSELLPEGTGTEVGRFVVQGIPPPEEGEDVPRIRVNVRHDIHGCFDVASAQFLKEKKEETPAPTPTPATAEKKEGEEGGEEKKEEGGEEKKKEEGGEDKQAAEAGDQAAEAKAEGAASEAQDAAAAGQQGGEAPKEAAAAGEAAAPPKKKKYTRVNLPCETQFLGMDAKELQEAREAELNMQSQDRTVEQAMHARNELESYMYDFRDKMISELASYATSEEKSRFEAKSEDMEDWLYSDEGTDCSASEYKAKHDELRAIAGPVQRRKVETEMRPPAITRLRGELDRCTKLVTENPELEHLTQEDRDTVLKECDTVRKWLEEKEAEQMKQPLTTDPVLTTGDLQGKVSALATICNPIVNKPKPKPEPETPKEDGGEQKQDADKQQQQQAQNGGQAQNGEASNYAAQQGGMEEEEEGGDSATPAEVE